MLVFAIASFIISLILTLIARKIALYFNIVDYPDKERKFHKSPVPLLGGSAIFLSFWSMVGFVVFFKPVFGTEILEQKLLAAFLSSLILLILGVADEIKSLPAVFRLMIVSMAVGLSVFLGVDLQKITNPFGGSVDLTNLFGNILVFVWLIGMTYTTKISDGVDGLVAGIVLIGAVMIFFLANSTQFFQPNVALLAIIFSGVMLGFLMFNFNPAKIFLGESGSLLSGFLLGILAVISGGKVATTLLVMAIPVFDLLRVIYLRFKTGQPVFSGDRKHLYFQLIERGYKEKYIVLFYYLLAIFFGALALFLQSTLKILALFLLLIAVFAFGTRWKNISINYGRE